MGEVRQAHLPGNYELYDPASSEPGPALCKICWEEGGLTNDTSLDTVWVSTDGRDAIWWLCARHREGLESKATEPTKVIRSVRGVARYPAPGETI
jgi:hypothetical protein